MNLLYWFSSKRTDVKAACEEVRVSSFSEHIVRWTVYNVMYRDPSAIFAS